MAKPKLPMLDHDAITWEAWGDPEPRPEPSTVRLRGGPTVPVNVVRLMLALKDRGVAVSVNATGGLRVRGRTTDEERETMRAHRDAVIAIVRYVSCLPGVMTMKDEICIGCGRRCSGTNRMYRNRCAACAQKHYMMTHYGYRLSHSPYRCPRQVAGLRCRGYRRSSCACERFRDILDHERLWIAPDGSYALTSEPYGPLVRLAGRSKVLHDHVPIGGVSGDTLNRLIDEMSALGVEVLIEPESPYFPGSTVLIHMRRAPLSRRQSRLTP